MAAWVCVRMNGCMDECMDVCLYVRMDGWKGGWMGGWMEVAGGVRTMSARSVLSPEESPCDSRPPAGHHSCEGWCPSRSAACGILGAPFTRKQKNC